MAKLGILGCPQFSCGELADLAAAAKAAKGVFAGLGPMDVVGCVACKRHPERRIIDGAKLLATWGADVIAFSCGEGENGDGLHYERVFKELSRQLGSTIILDCRNGLGA